MTKCSSDLITKGCQCLANPIVPGSNVCAYINNQNGLVSPCDVGCCVPQCKDAPSTSGTPSNILQFQNEFRASTGTSLPPGFGINLETSDRPTVMKGAYDFTPPDIHYQAVWERIAIPVLMLVIVVLAIMSLA